MGVNGTAKLDSIHKIGINLVVTFIFGVNGGINSLYKMSFIEIGSEWEPPKNF